jgi:hypothetical protein
VRPPFRALLLSILGLLALILEPSSAGADPGPHATPTHLRADPPALTFGDDDRKRDGTIRIYNEGDSPVELDSLRIVGQDWGGFPITDERNPTTIDPRASVEVHLRADPKAFLMGQDDLGRAEYRSGRAELEIRSAETRFQIPLHFNSRPARPFGPGLVLFLLWSLLLRSFLRREGATPTPLIVRWFFACGALLCLATLPLSPGWCFTDAPVGELALARCQDGLGGSPAAVLAGARSGLFLFAGLCGMVLALLHGPTPRVALERLAWMALTMALLAAQSGSWDLTRWAAASTWHPGLALALLASWSRLRTRAIAAGHSHRLDTAIWAGAFVWVFAHGSHPHFLVAAIADRWFVLALGLFLLAAKLALTVLTLRWIGDRGAASRAFQALVGLGACADLLYSLWPVIT